MQSLITFGLELSHRVCVSIHDEDLIPTVTTRCNHPPMGVCSNNSLTSFYHQLVHTGGLGPLGHTSFYWPIMASGHILLSLAFLTNPPPHQPPGQFLCFGPGGSSGLPGAFGPSSNHQGLNGLFGPFRPPMASTVCKTLRPPLAKRGKGGKPPTFKARWVPNHKWAQVPQMAKRSPGTKLAKNHVLATFNSWPLAITRGHHIKLRKDSPSYRGKTSLHQCTLYHGFRNGAYMV
ncbi:hypothetical protein O181_022207 [Austropuccinia psidii MF-1]|uniref:Uncharacterized protein n=1 Tax=Austropuccinia psidii MF-1 TaxID=1389203 RepID=A0A9Q3CH14_9BASI|nr:hypothetical protein [Austropuccinia psidii MF-1]